MDRVRESRSGSSARGHWVVAVLLALALHPLQARTEVGSPAPSASSSCLPGVSRSVGAVHFPILQPRQVGSQGVFGFERGVPNAVLQRLAARHPEIRVRRAEVRRLLEPSGSGVEPRNPEVRNRVRNLARLWNVDYLVSGILLDLGWDPMGWPPGRDRRQAELEIFLFAGDTGELVLQHRTGGQAIGNILHDQRVEFASLAFFASDYGKLFDRLLDELTDALSAGLGCSPEADSGSPTGITR